MHRAGEGKRPAGQKEEEEKREKYRKPKRENAKYEQLEDEISSERRHLNSLFRSSFSVLLKSVVCVVLKEGTERARELPSLKKRMN